MSRALKFDKGKPDLSLIPRTVREQVARAMEYGAQKYGRYNYTHGLEAARLVAAAERHLLAWYEREDKDPESHVNHLAHVMANCLMLLHTQELGTLKDNRPAITGDGAWTDKISYDRIDESGPRPITTVEVAVKPKPGGLY